MKHLALSFCLLTCMYCSAAERLSGTITEYDLGEWAYRQHLALMSQLRQSMHDNYKPVLVKREAKLEMQDIFSIVYNYNLEIRNESVVLYTKEKRPRFQREYVFRKTPLFKILPEDVLEYISYYPRRQQLIEDSIPAVSRDIIQIINKAVLWEICDTGKNAYESYYYERKLEKRQQVYLGSDANCQVRFITMVEPPDDPGTIYDSMTCIPGYPADSNYMHGIILSMEHELLNFRISGIASCYKTFYIPYKHYKMPFLDSVYSASLEPFAYIKKEELSVELQNALVFLERVMTHRVLLELKENMLDPGYFRRFNIRPKK